MTLSSQHKCLISLSFLLLRIVLGLCAPGAVSNESYAFRPAESLVHSRSTPEEIAFDLELWVVGDDGKLTLEATQELVVDVRSSNILQYMRLTGSANESTTEWVARDDRDPMVAFSDDASLLRIGSLIYSIGTDEQYHLLSYLANADGCPEYIEDAAAVRNVTVLTRRSGPIAFEVRQALSHDAQPTSKMIDGAEDIEDGASDDGQASSEDEDEAYESWSDCSSDDADTVESDDESIVSAPGEDQASVSDGSVWDDLDEHDKEPQNNDEDSEVEEEVPDTQNDAADDAESSDASDIDPEKYAFFDWQVPNETTILPTRKERDSDDAASIDIFTPSGKVFHLTTGDASYLSDSAPVLHENEPLVVWLLNDRELLFADYRENTYFTKALGNSSSKGECSRFRYASITDVLDCQPLTPQSDASFRLVVDSFMSQQWKQMISKPATCQETTTTKKF